MKKMIFVLTTSMIGMAGAASALTAMEDAIARKACDGGPILTAEYRTDGKLEVRCPVAADVAAAGGTVAGGAGAGAAVLGGTTLAAGPALGLAFTVAVLAAAGGGGGGTTTTTTTTTGTGGSN